MLCFNPVDRISCASALKHPYFRDYAISVPVTNNITQSGYKSSKSFKVSFHFV